ncbi:MAG: hypothetical protein Q6351_003345 [Candidatus Njordarchaeum guaymaensis]
MLRENWGSINGIIDVSILVIAHIIPTTAFTGAYHILTNISESQENWLEMPWFSL